MDFNSNLNLKHNYNNLNHLNKINKLKWNKKILN